MPVVLPQQTSLIPTVIDALVGLFTAGVNLPVTDGPPLQNLERKGLYVAATIDDTPIDFQQRWPGLGHAVRDETFEVPCLLYVQTGDVETVSATRLLTFQYVALVEQILRSNPTLGIATNTVRAQYGTAGDYLQAQTGDGFLARVRFSINIEGRI